MKKVKIMLTAITVFAVVGGALAFKAKAPGFKLYKCNAANRCAPINVLTTYTTTNPGLGEEFTSATITNVAPAQNIPCSQLVCTSTITVTAE